MPLIATRGAASAQGFGEFAQSAPANYIEDVFQTWLYTGNGSTQTITNGIDLSTKGGLVWLKGRSLGYNNGLFDTIRGADYLLCSNNTDPSTSVSGIPANAWITGFNANGFGLGSNGSANASTQTYVSWTFREQPKFFDVVTYTGNGSSKTINHSLGSTPGFIITKRTDSTSNWRCYHRSLGTTGAIDLNATSAAFTGLSNYYTSVGSTSYSIGDGSEINTNGATYIAYLFAHDAGGFGLAGDQNVITCGSYTGNGSSTGPTITLGYEPQWILIKNTSSAQNWYLLDNMRGMPVGSADANLIPNLSNAESDSTVLSPTATGFQLDTAGSPNNNGNTFIYIAIRRGPMKTPTSSTSVFKAQTYSGNSTANRFFTTGFPIDANLTSARNSSGYAYPCLGSRLTDGMHETYSDAYGYDPLTDWIDYDYNNGYELPTAYQYSNNTTVGSYVSLSFQRAPGFMDVVCYTGTGSARTLSHNLGTTPELIIIKIRAATQNWAVYNSSVGNTKALFLNSSIASTTSSAYWNDTTPTSSVFTVGTSNLTNQNTYTYVAYLFASVTGVSKVGSYSGTGSTQTINCGFTNGASFVLIRRTDSSGDWYFWDSARGIVAGNDPYLLLNSTAAEVTNTDYIDTASSGFEISSTAPAAINANGGTFIFLAIA